MFSAVTLVLVSLLVPLQPVVDAAAAVGGPWSVRGRPARIETNRQGRVIAVVNADGERESAKQDGLIITISGWQASGEIVPNGLAIIWSTGAVWTRGDASGDRPSEAAGDWWSDGPCVVGTNGAGQVIFVRDAAYQTAGAYQVGTSIRVPKWNGRSADSSPDAQTLSWSDGTRWVRPGSAGAAR